MRLRGLTTLALALALTTAWASEAQAQAVISNGTVTLGVNAAGHLNYGYNPSTGLPYGLSIGTPPTYESTSPGCLCEGWGAGISGGTYDLYELGYNESWGGSLVSPWWGASAAVTSFTSTASTAKSVVELSAGSTAVMRITHDYHPIVGVSALYQVDVTIENLTASTLGSGSAGIRYRRVMDWDIIPTAFAEYVTMYGNGTTANLISSSNDGFDSPLPFSDGNGIWCGSGTLNDVDFVDVGPCDHGALFDFGFAALSPGASVSFKTFYGGAIGASAEATVLAALSAVGAEAYSLGQCNPSPGNGCDPTTGAPVTHAFAFAGVGGTPISTVPEPGTWLLMATGLLGLGGVASRRRRGA